MTNSGTHLLSHSDGNVLQNSWVQQENAAELCGSTFIQMAPFMHQNPSSYFSQPCYSDHIAVCLQQSAYLLLRLSLWTEQITGTTLRFLLSRFFFLDRSVCGEMCRWIPVILLSHSQAAGSHGGALAVYSQERDSITGICLSVPQSEGNPLQTPTGRKTNRGSVYH